MDTELIKGTLKYNISVLGGWGSDKIAYVGRGCIEAKGLCLSLRS